MGDCEWHEEEGRKEIGKVSNYDRLNKPVSEVRGADDGHGVR